MPEENFSSQLKQSPCARLLCISSQDSLLTGDVVVEVEGTSEMQVAGGGGRENSFCRSLLKITELPTNFLVGKQYFLVGKPITDHLPTKLFSHNFPGR